MDDDLKSELIRESDYGIEYIVASLEAAYQKSCANNQTTDTDLRYLREYIWALIALQELRFRKIEKDL